MAKAFALTTLGARLVDESTRYSLPVRPCQAEEMLVWLLHLGLLHIAGTSRALSLEESCQQESILDARTDGWMGYSVGCFCRFVLIPLLLLSNTFQFLFLFLRHVNIERLSEDL